MEVSRAQFFEQRHRRFGTRNPERMMVPFWEFMVRSGKWAHWASDLFQERNREHTAPIWCFDRFGMSRTSLSDGRTVFIAGEHEDHYDPDFCIYNDVVIRGPGDQVEILGYPRELFPPTDFHTATPLGDRIIVIGNLGYPADRRPGYTQVFELSVPEFQMKRLETAGEPPGWLSRHTAKADGEKRILIHGGRVAMSHAQSGRLRKNLEDFSLDLASGQWKQVTHRNWREFLIRLETPKIIGTQVIGTG